MKPGALLVATILAGKGPDLTDTFREAARAHLQKEGFRDPVPTWLTPKRALDIFVPSDQEDRLRKTLIALIGDAPFDCVVQNSAHRQKKLMIADMESTIIEQEMLDELATHMGIKEKIAAITRRTMNGEIDFPTALRQRIQMMKGQPSSLIETVSAQITLMPGAEELCRTMKKTGATLWLVSGGLAVFADPIGRRLGFDAVFANHIEVANGVITGEVREPILEPSTKAKYLKDAAAQKKIDLNETLAIGDGANDIPMLETCHKAGGLGLAFHAKPLVRTAIPNQLNVSDLTGALLAQGLGANLNG